MRTLITGINGFVGGYLAEHLLASGEWQIWGLSRQDKLEQPHLRNSVQHVNGDLAEVEPLNAILQTVAPDVIFHLAGQSNVPRSFADPAGTITNNVLSTLILIEAALKCEPAPLLVIVGSQEMYGLVTPEDLPINELTPLRPVNPYAVSKATVDLLAYQYFVSHKARTIRLRPFNHIGPRQSERFVSSAFAAQIARIEAGLQEPLLRVGNLAAERDFTDVRDMVAAYESAARAGVPGEAYNIGSDRTVSVQYLLDVLLSLSRVPIRVEPDPARMRPADVPRVVCDSRRFRATTGWKPCISIEQTLSDLLAYWRMTIQQTRSAEEQ
jgi:GDP-4-dehydro-6-deoxy-D-mannose reductase